MNIELRFTFDGSKVEKSFL